MLYLYNHTIILVRCPFPTSLKSTEKSQLDLVELSGPTCARISSPLSTPPPPAHRFVQTPARSCTQLSPKKTNRTTPLASSTRPLLDFPQCRSNFPCCWCSSYAPKRLHRSGWRQGGGTNKQGEKETNKERRKSLDQTRGVLVAESISQLEGQTTTG